MPKKQIAVIGGGPAGLKAADALSAQGHAVTVFDAMPTMGRKFLLAGKSGLNLTHAEDFATYLQRFGPVSGPLQHALADFRPEDIRFWADQLGAKTFVGSSGRVFPKAMKASPLLRAWLARLAQQGVTFRTRHRWTGFSGPALTFDTSDGPYSQTFDATLLALGGASWPRLGSDAGWVGTLAEQGVEIADFRPANCGFDIAWSDSFRTRFSGAAVKSVIATSDAGSMPGEFVITSTGIEGGLIYAHAASLRDRLEQKGEAHLLVDLTPGRSEERLTRDLARQDAKASLSTLLRKGASLEGVKAGLVRECGTPADFANAQRLASLIKALPVAIERPRPIAEAISSAGGIRLEAMDDHFMLKALPGVFAAGEMLDWEAPTGGYLLSACLATGKAAAQGIGIWLDRG